MVGKREKQRKNRLRLPGALLALTAAVLLLSSGRPSGVAADSPAEAPEPARQMVPAAAILAEPEAEQPPEEQPSAQEQPWAPVPESEAVEDTYFDDVVFLGDSRTDGFRLYSGLETGTYLCATGATVESVFTKAVETGQGKLPLLDALAETPCGKIYVMLGVNELGWNGTDIFRDQCGRMIDRIRSDHPEAVLVLQSIIPVSRKQDEKGTYVNNARVDAYNTVLRELAEEKDCPFVNVAEAVTDGDGFLRADWNFDGVHLNQAGCRAWLSYLRTHPVTAEN